MLQDFSHQNLRGRSFKGQNLSGANFSHADIRGTDFSGANLRGADFAGVTAGIENSWKITFFITAASLLLISSIFLVIVALFIASLYNLFNFIDYAYNGIAVLIIFVVFLVIAVYRNLGVNLIFLAVATSGVISGLISLAYATYFENGIAPQVFKIARDSIVCVGVTVAFAFPVIATVAVVVAILVAVVSILIGVVAFPCAILIIIFFMGFVSTLKLGSDISNAFLCFGLIPVVALPSIYIAWKSLAEDDKHSYIRNIAIALAAMRGTNFQNADLTEVNFNQAILKNTNLRNTILFHTCWYEAQILGFARLGETYLQNREVRQLLITGQGQSKNFERQDLRGVNLKGANLADASFIGADLSQANLQDADLYRAKLVQTQLDGTDFTGATLTGAFIEDWNITTDTKFDGVRCEYVYMRLPTPDNPDPHRKPDNRQEVFADGEFGDFIKPIFDTLDLYHNQAVDPRAIAISFKQLAENHPDAELEIVAIEKRSENNFLLRAKTVLTANKSQLNAEYFELYNNLKTLPKEDLIFLLAQRDGQIQSLEVAFKTVNQGLITVAETPKKQSNFNLQGAQFAGGLVDADTVTAYQIGGNITNYTPEQRQNLTEAAAEIQQLLNQLGQTYPTNTPLEKQIAVTEALKQIDSNPTLKARVIGALKSGGTEALKELVDHPLVNILLATLEGWQDAE